jgi:predicted RNA-binding Zn-ribbon protein involved in translation (DUF1610 family)
MQSDHSVAELADDGGQVTYDIPRPGTDRHRAVGQALADALALARLQAEVLVRLQEADEVGDDEAALLCHAELDHVMARMAEAEQVRVGSKPALAAGNDLMCAGCGEAAEPVYEKPRLLGYRCTHCGWEGDDPAVRDEQKRAEALGQARVAVEQAVERVGDALGILGHRGKKAKEEGSAVLRGLQADLAALGKRLRKTS